MAQAALVSDDIERGRSVLRALSTSGVRPRAAFWYSTSESPDWKFVIAMPSVGQKGPRRFYERVQRILKEKHVDLPVWRITLTSTDDPLARWARARVAGARGDVRSTGNIVNSTAITDAYIYGSPSAAR